MYSRHILPSLCCFKAQFTQTHRQMPSQDHRRQQQLEVESIKLVERLPKSRESTDKRGSLCAHRRSRKTVSCHGSSCGGTRVPSGLIAQQMEEVEGRNGRRAGPREARFVNLSNLTRQSCPWCVFPFASLRLLGGHRSQTISAMQVRVLLFAWHTCSIFHVTCPPRLLQKVFCLSSFRCDGWSFISFRMCFVCHPSDAMAWSFRPLFQRFW